MSKATAFLWGAALGAAAVYLWDPDEGNRRRALIRDQGVSARRRMVLAVSQKAQDAANRLQGVAARIRQSTESIAESLESSQTPEG
jgi:gas vesicle protein